MFRVNEIFGPTIQGEGKSLGKQVMFLRLSGCNLYCIWCDTPYTWNWVATPFKHPDKYSKESERTSMMTQEVIHKLISLDQNARGDVWSNKTKALVISGGEPLLQQKELVPLVEKLKQYGWWIEVETNGTIEPTDELLAQVDQINCSPKLENSAVALLKRQKPDALRKLARCGKANFKFVVSSEQDMTEIVCLTDQYKMTDVYLMPEGRSKEELKAHEDMVKLMCEKYFFKYTPRRHIELYGAKRAV